MDRLSTCNIRSSVSFESRVCDAFNPRKNVLYSSADTIAIKSLVDGWATSRRTYIKRYYYLFIVANVKLSLTLAQDDRNHVNSISVCRATSKLCQCPKRPPLCFDYTQSKLKFIYCFSVPMPRRHFRHWRLGKRRRRRRQGCSFLQRHITCRQPHESRTYKRIAC